MTDEFDYELTPAQWAALKALRLPAVQMPHISPIALDRLVALGLAIVDDDSAFITSRGRKVLVRGSSALLHDVAA